MSILSDFLAISEDLKGSFVPIPPISSCRFLDKTLSLLVRGRIIASMAVGKGRSWLPSVLSSLRLSICSIPFERAGIIYWGKDPHYSWNVSQGPVTSRKSKFGDETKSRGEKAGLVMGSLPKPVMVDVLPGSGGAGEAGCPRAACAVSGIVPWPQLCKQEAGEQLLNKSFWGVCTKLAFNS